MTLLVKSRRSPSASETAQTKPDKRNPLPTHVFDSVAIFISFAWIADLVCIEDWVTSIFLDAGCEIEPRIREHFEQFVAGGDGPITFSSWSPYGRKPWRARRRAVRHIVHTPNTPAWSVSSKITSHQFSGGGCWSFATTERSALIPQAGAKCVLTCSWRADVVFSRSAAETVVLLLITEIWIVRHF